MVKKIQFKTINDAKTFVAKTANCKFDVDLISGRYVIDAKSIMGIFSLDLEKPMELKIYSDDCKEYLSSIKDFLLD